MIEAHIVAWNEAETIHLTIKHYKAFCSHIILWDNHSTDTTREIAKALGCTVKTFGKEGELSDRAYMELKNECWKKNHPGKDRRDYVIVVDADEILVNNYELKDHNHIAHTWFLFCFYRAGIYTYAVSLLDCRAFEGLTTNR